MGRNPKFRDICPAFGPHPSATLAGLTVVRSFGIALLL